MREAARLEPPPPLVRYAELDAQPLCRLGLPVCMLHMHMCMHMHMHMCMHMYMLCMSCMHMYG